MASGCSSSCLLLRFVTYLVYLGAAQYRGSAIMQMLNGLWIKSNHALNALGPASSHQIETHLNETHLSNSYSRSFGDWNGVQRSKFNISLGLSVVAMMIFVGINDRGIEESPQHHIRSQGTPLRVFAVLCTSHTNASPMKPPQTK